MRTLSQSPKHCPAILEADDIGVEYGPLIMAELQNASPNGG